MIDKTVYLESCKILSRKLRNAAEWRRGIRCRGGIVGISLGCPLENVRGAYQGCWENGRAKEPATLGPRAWLRGMKQPLPRKLEYNQTSPFPFSDRDAAVVSSDDLVEAGRSRYCQRQSYCRG